jgi:AmiR/NasT family two-component response regulator
MDIGLKGEIDGIEAATRIRREFDLPVIFLTAFTTPTILERARRAEPYGYVVKPFDECELVSNIEMAVYKHRTEKKIARKRKQVPQCDRTCLGRYRAHGQLWKHY